MGISDRATLSIMQAAGFVGVSRRTIYNWIAAGKVNYLRTAGGSIRVFADELLTLQEKAPESKIGQNRLPPPRRDVGTFLS